MNSMIDSNIPIFGSPLPGVCYRKRPAAYAIIRNRAGEIAVVREPSGYWLPGGGSDPGETPEEAVIREVREELGYDFHIAEKIGEAIQYFYASTDNEHYEMHAVFFLGELTGNPLGSKEYEICWLDIPSHLPFFFHSSHDWATRLHIAPPDL